MVTTAANSTHARSAFVTSRGSMQAWGLQAEHNAHWVVQIIAQARRSCSQHILLALSRSRSALHTTA